MAACSFLSVRWRGRVKASYYYHYYYYVLGQDSFFVSPLVSMKMGERRRVEEREREHFDTYNRVCVCVRAHTHANTHTHIHTHRSATLLET